MEAQNVHDHGGDGCFTVASPNDHADFIFGLLVKILRIGEYFQSQFLCTQQFRVILPGVHSQDDCIQVTSDCFGKPAFTVRQQPVFSQTASGRFKNLIIRTSNLVPFLVQGNGQIVHGTSANGYKMYIHFYVFRA